MTERHPAEQAFSLKSIFCKSFDKYGDRVALEYLGDSYTYADLNASSNQLANAFVDELGLESEDRVALLMSNRPEFTVTELAILKAGGAKVLLNDMLAREEIKYILTNSRAETIVCGPGFVELIDELYDSIPTLQNVIYIREDAVVDRFVEYESFRSQGGSANPPDVTPSPDDVAFHAYTGGTTGKPKGVLHTHRSRAMLYYSVLVELDLSGSDTLLATTPLPHSVGSFTRSAFLAGAKVVLYPDFEVERTFRDIQDAQITWTFMVPTMIYRLLDSPAINEYDLSSLETLIYGAAPMKADRLREGIDQFGPVFKQFYGQTEVPNLITTLGKDEHVLALETGNEEWLSSAGQPCLMADVKIVDPKTRAEQPVGEPGEILASAPYMMKKYFERPDATAETLLDGWVATGDIGKRDEYGYITLLDRSSNMVITGGMNVYTTEVEEALVKHDAVSDVAVIGVPDDDWGEAVTAIVVPYDGQAVSGDDIISSAATRLSSYKVPKRVEFVDDLPKTPYGKVDKKALRDRYWEGEDRQIS